MVGRRKRNIDEDPLQGSDSAGLHSTATYADWEYPDWLSLPPMDIKKAVIGMDKRSLSERDICTKFITPALRKAGWDEMLQISEEVSLTKGRIIVRGKLVSRGQAKRADYVLYYKPNIPLAQIEAKDNTHSVGAACSRASTTLQR
jgi:hypothetical protein